MFKLSAAKLPQRCNSSQPAALMPLRWHWLSGVLSQLHTRLRQALHLRWNSPFEACTALHWLLTLLSEALAQPLPLVTTTVRHTSIILARSRSHLLCTGATSEHQVLLSALGSLLSLGAGSDVHPMILAQATLAIPAFCPLLPQPAYVHAVPTVLEEVFTRVAYSRPPSVASTTPSEAATQQQLVRQRACGALLSLARHATTALLPLLPALAGA
jgi:hypothetical protein